MPAESLQPWSSQEHMLTEGNGTSVCFCLFVPSFHKGAMLFVLGNSGAHISLSHAATQRIVKPSRKSLVISYRDIETNLLPSNGESCSLLETLELWFNVG